MQSPQLSEAIRDSRRPSNGAAVLALLGSLFTGCESTPSPHVGYVTCGDKHFVAHCRDKTSSDFPAAVNVDMAVGANTEPRRVYHTEVPACTNETIMKALRQAIAARAGEHCTDIEIEVLIRK